MKIYPSKTDLFFENNKMKNIELGSNETKIKYYVEKEYDYKTIFFNNLENVENILKLEIQHFFDKLNIKKGNHIFVVGLGNDNHTADSVGPKTLKHIKVNSYLKNLEIETDKTIVSALEPGVLGETGIMTNKIIKSVVDEIKPDLVILIDSFVSGNINYLNKTIEVTDFGLNPGGGLKGINEKIDNETLGIPVIVIGVTTSIEVKFTNEENKNFIPYLLSSKDVDDYVNKISLIVGESINASIDDLE